MEVGSAQGTEQGVAENAAKTGVGVFHGEEGGISVEGEGGGSPWMMEREGEGGGEEGRCRCWRLESWSIRRVTPGIAARATKNRDTRTKRRRQRIYSNKMDECSGCCNAENTNAENINAENTNAENTNVENTNAENTNAGNANAETQQCRNTNARSTSLITRGNAPE